MLRKKGHVPGLAAWLCLTASMAVHAQSGVPPKSPPTFAKAGYTCEAELLLAVRINGILQPACEHITRLNNKRLAASSEALQHWRLRVPAISPVPYQGENFYPLDTIPGLRYRMDEAAQELQLTIPPAAFLPNRINEATALQRNPQVSPGGFFNYDLLTQNSTNAQQVSNGLLEAGIFNQHGVGTSTFLWQNHGVPQELTRLETAWTSDDPESITRFQVGDSITRAGTWGRAVRFGGLQWRTNFDTQPGFVTFPQPNVAGIAALPSTVDIYVNNTRRLREDVQSGPFAINNVPVVTGAGQVQLVVKDMLGRQQVITQPYYASQSLLREGLDDHSYEIGYVRQDYGLLSDRYGQAFGIATHRYGLSDRFTRELRAEVLPGQQTLGAGGTYLWPNLGTAQAALAASHGNDGNGALFTTGIERISRPFSWSAQEQIASPRFTELGFTAGNVRPRNTLSLHIGLPVGGEGGALSLSHLNQRYWDQAGNRIWSLNYSRNLFRDFSLLLFATSSASGGGTDHSIGFNISHYFGERTSGNIQSTHQKAGTDNVVQVQKNLPEGPGFGYRLLAEDGLGRRQEANGSWQTNVGTYTAGISRQSGDSTSRLGASGGIAFLGGSAFLSRRIDDSFAVVNAGGYPDVRVNYENRLAGITDDRGLALIPHLRPYQQNHISVEEGDLPIEAQIEKRELLLIPALRSGSYAEFPIKATHGGTLTILLDDGSFIPSGATVMLLDQEDEYPVGLRGEVFLPALAESNELLVVWKGQGCQIDLRLPPNSPPLADLGRRVCKGVKR